MLVIMTDRQILSPQQVCQNCLLADQAGHPRWHHGQLRCAHAIPKIDAQQPTQYECQMGFRVVTID